VFQILQHHLAQHLFNETAMCAVLERQVRALLAELDAPGPRPKQLTLEDLSDERASSPATSKDAVYPVWFGTNRKPGATGAGFPYERHTHTTLGRVLVHVPEAHRFGETGNSFWRRLLPFELRDDRLRIQQVEQRERDAFFSEIHEAMQAARDGG